MSQKKKPEKKKVNMPNAEIEGGGVVVEQKITSTLEQNYMPYAMSVIVSRALPEIDGFKPSHRKLLYTMYKMGLLSGTKTKSANIVGQTMRLNPHGDGAIYETMVRLSRGNEALLHPYMIQKGISEKHIQGIWHMPHHVIRRRSLTLCAMSFSAILTKIRWILFPITIIRCRSRYFFRLLFRLFS